MNESIIIAGFGGQGVLSMGKILAYAGLMEQKHVSWMPAYGPEQRGGAANVTVILSDAPIRSPILKTFGTAILLNQQSLDKFESRIRPGGLLVYDPKGISRPPARTDIRICSVPALDAATEMRHIKALNMIALGAYLKIQPVVSLDSVMEGLKKSLPARHHHLLPANQAALVKGQKIVVCEPFLSP